MPISGTLVQVLAAMLRLYSLMLVVYALLSCLLTCSTILKFFKKTL